MADMFITKIQIDKVRHLENFTIELSDTERKHLILTGKNGSGKTSVLEAIRGKLSSFPGHTDNVDVGITLKELSSATIIQDDSKNKFFKFPKENIFLYVPAERKLNVSQQNTVKKITPTSSKDILQYMIWLDYLQMNAERNGDMVESGRIKKWFLNLQQIFRDIYDCENLLLNYKPEELECTIEIPGRITFGFNEMADGYSAFLTIFLDLMMQMDGKGNIIYDLPGIVLIDEIETHLHVELQKKVLPLLATMFPNIQFIVTTHSPFVIESFEGAIVYDLERQERNVITEAKSANETVREMLGVSITIPVWAEKKLNAIIGKYISQNAEDILFENMKKELEDSGLSSFFPESMANVLRGEK